ncbi:hypothetical protein [uncultured Draconibacterium sp.]|uniref:dioxygenase family protein n=1 Tax=uncultured Draconibacterium sp. TaxID=1573823 RepID=UPI003260898E
MNSIKSRRLFLRNAGLVSLGIAAIPNPLSAAKAIDTKTDENAELQDPGNIRRQLLVKGRVYDKKAKRPLSNAEIEVWHDADKWSVRPFHKKVITDENGYYQFVSKRPDKLNGQSPRINFKLSNSVDNYNTELLVNDFGAFITDKHWVMNRAIGDELFPQFKNLPTHTELTFNLTI